MIYTARIIPVVDERILAPGMLDRMIGQPIRGDAGGVVTAAVVEDGWLVVTVDTGDEAEDDEPVEKIQQAFDAGERGVTLAPRIITDHDAVPERSGSFLGPYCTVCDEKVRYHWSYAASIADKVGGRPEDYLPGR